MILKKPSTWLVLVGLAGAFVAGKLLRGPISGGADWCRDVDYGNLPQWVTAAIAAGVGIFTIFNVLLARRSYVEQNENLEFAQARLVYADVPRSRYIEPGEFGT